MCGRKLLGETAGHPKDEWLGRPVQNSGWPIRDKNRGQNCAQLLGDFLYASTVDKLKKPQNH